MALLVWMRALPAFRFFHFSLEENILLRFTAKKLVVCADF